MKVPQHIVNLDLDPEERWTFLLEYACQIDELVEYYTREFTNSNLTFDNILKFKSEIISDEYLKEIKFISNISKFSFNQVLIANMYYDISKFHFGCTAFAVCQGDTIFHSRNLDWHTENSILSKYSQIFHFQRNKRTIYKSIGWPGFIGVFSGTKPGRFSLTLNAVSSIFKPELAKPVSFLLRDVLNSSSSFLEAREMIENSIIASDSLILLSGIEPNEIVVIERTPKRFETRFPSSDFIIVTNNYRQFNSAIEVQNDIQSTSPDRYRRVEYLLTKEKPKDINCCLKILNDDEILMDTTVQKIVFNNRTGEIGLRLKS